MTLSGLAVNVSNFLMLAQGEGADAPAAGGDATVPPSPFSMLPMFVILGVLFYFMMIRPQQKDAKKRRELLSSLKKNDKVVTIGGIIGTITDITSDRATIKVDDGTRIKFLRSSIQGTYEENSESKDKA